MLKWRRSNSRIQAYDRRLAAVHEGGHFVAGGHFGLRSYSAWIGPTPDSDAASEKTWIGQFSYYQRELDKLRPKHRTMIALAGAVAANVWRDRHDPPFFEDLLCDPSFMSASDWAMAGCAPGDATARVERYAYELGDLFRGHFGTCFVPSHAIS
jgi:hypothetical protein